MNEVNTAILEELITSVSAGELPKHGAIAPLLALSEARRDAIVIIMEHLGEIKG